MSDDLDSSVQEAWVDLRRRLADRMADLRSDGDFASLELPSYDDTVMPYAQAWLSTSGLLHAQLSSNRHLDRVHRLGKHARRAVRRLGWQRPVGGYDNYWTEVDPAYVDQVAAMMVGAMRDAFGVIHPAFLELDPGLVEAEHTTISGLPEVDDDGPAIRPTDEGDLERLIDLALSPVCGETPQRDVDGDVPFKAGPSIVYVRQLPGSPTIRLFAPLVREVTKPGRAAFEVAVLNRDVPGVKFVLAHAMVTASVDISAYPFAPEHLRQWLVRMTTVAERHTADLAHRVGGRCFVEPADHERHDRGA